MRSLSVISMITASSLALAACAAPEDNTLDSTTKEIAEHLDTVRPDAAAFEADDLGEDPIADAAAQTAVGAEADQFRANAVLEAFGASLEAGDLIEGERAVSEQFTEDLITARTELFESEASLGGDVLAAHPGLSVDDVDVEVLDDDAVAVRWSTDPNDCGITDHQVLYFATAVEADEEHQLDRFYSTTGCGCGACTA